MSALTEKTMGELVSIHNELAKKLGHRDAGPKTFSTRAKAVARIEKMEAELAAAAEPAEAEKLPCTICKGLKLDPEAKSSVCDDCAEGLDEAMAIADAKDEFVREELEAPAPVDRVDAILEMTRAEAAGYEAESTRHLEDTREAHGLMNPAVVEARKADDVTAPRAARPEGTPPIRATAEELLMKRDEGGRGLPYSEVLAAIHAKYPGAQTSNNCLRWYAARMREEGKQLPERPRAKAQKLAQAAADGAAK